MARHHELCLTAQAQQELGSGGGGGQGGGKGKGKDGKGKDGKGKDRKGKDGKGKGKGGKRDKMQRRDLTAEGGAETAQPPPAVNQDTPAAAEPQVDAGAAARRRAILGLVAKYGDPVKRGSRQWFWQCFVGLIKGILLVLAGTLLAIGLRLEGAANFQGSTVHNACRHELTGVVAGATTKGAKKKRPAKGQMVGMQRRKLTVGYNCRGVVWLGPTTTSVETVFDTGGSKGSIDRN